MAYPQPMEPLRGHHVTYSAPYDGSGNYDKARYQPPHYAPPNNPPPPQYVQPPSHHHHYHQQTTTQYQPYHYQQQPSSGTTNRHLQSDLSKVRTSSILLIVSTFALFSLSLYMATVSGSPMIAADLQASTYGLLSGALGAALSTRGDKCTAVSSLITAVASLLCDLVSFGYSCNILAYWGISYRSWNFGRPALTVFALSCFLEVAVMGCVIANIAMTGIIIHRLNKSNNRRREAY